MIVANTAARPTLWRNRCVIRSSFEPIAQLYFLIVTVSDLDVFFLVDVVTVIFTTQVPAASVRKVVPETLHLALYFVATVRLIVAFFGSVIRADFTRLEPEIVFFALVVRPIASTTTGTVTCTGASVVLVGARVVVVAASWLSLARTVGAECENPVALNVSHPFSSLMLVVALPSVPAASITEISALTGALVKL